MYTCIDCSSISSYLKNIANAAVLDQRFAQLHFAIQNLPFSLSGHLEDHLSTSSCFVATSVDIRLVLRLCTPVCG